MNSKTLCWAIRTIVVLVLAVATGALAQEPALLHLSGTINDYTAQVDPKTGDLGGPWELRGSWSLDLRETGTADFSAALNMTRSDYWVVLNPTAVDDDSKTGRNPHTHHIVMKNATVKSILNGFEVSGPITTISGNGGGFPKPLPFNCSASACTLTIDITGGSIVKYSNIAMTFGGPATTHLGSQAIHGVVRKVQFGDAD